MADKFVGIRIKEEAYQELLKRCAELGCGQGEYLKALVETELLGRRRQEPIKVTY